MLKMNPEEIYRDSGYKAGRGSKVGDWALVRFESDWLRRALSLESDDGYKKNMHEVWNSAYKEGAARS